MTSWLAVGVIGLIGVLTGIRLFFWFINRDRRGSVTVNPPLVAHDQLGGNDYLETPPPPYDNDGVDDDKPLPP